MKGPIKIEMFKFSASDSRFNTLRNCGSRTLHINRQNRLHRVYAVRFQIYDFAFFNKFTSFNLDIGVLITIRTLQIY